MNYCLALYNNSTTKYINLKSEMVLGSSLDCDIILPDLQPRHAKIQTTADCIRIYDLSTEGGVYLNLQRIDEVELKNGDMIKMGSHEFLILNSNEVCPLDFHRSANKIWDQSILKLPYYAISDLPTLITGESGTGKELVSQLIHTLSPRKKSSVVTVNCSALAPSLAESELFGHIRGAYTGATQDRKGAFEEARGGTLILDEVGDLPMELQPKLLRALENKEIKPVGGDSVIKTDCRIVACTHQNLEEKIMKGEFRLDLYYRLNVIRIHVPSLYERAEDFDRIITKFCRELKVSFTTPAIYYLKDQKWSGNIRQLKNFVNRCKIYYPNQRIGVDEAKNILSSENKVAQSLNISRIKNLSYLKQVEKNIIIQILANNKGNRMQTAKDLGFAKSTLYDKVKSYGIDVEKFKV